MLPTAESPRKNHRAQIKGGSETKNPASVVDYFEPEPTKECNAAAKAGGAADINAKQDLGFMHGRSVLDLEGHIWAFFWMDPAAVAG